MAKSVIIDGKCFAHSAVHMFVSEKATADLRGWKVGSS